ncbi:YkvA family protein [Halomonas salina]|uniref:DUF1232 domain-containing protein n=1 Tax=Halomonas salina TaxID=42565 RepID=A0ABR4WWT3_9GAMM|nr:YkvA family protein [Halomonas salina]KGE79188.1 hypothetical protein FP66_14975 [Halomonas salina]
MARPDGSSPLTRIKRRAGVFLRMRRALRWFPPMLADVVRGRYRPVPWSALLWMLVALVYLISPLDLIPDVLLVVGLVDDAMIVGWLLTRVDRSLEGYRAWRETDG